MDLFDSQVDDQMLRLPSATAFAEGRLVRRQVSTDALQCRQGAEW